MGKIDLNNILNKIEIKKIIQHRNFSAGLIVLLVVLFILDILFISMPEIKTIKNLDSNIKQNVGKINISKAELVDIKEFKESLANKSKELNSEENMFASEDDLELLIETISKAASETNVKILQLKPVKENVAKEPKPKDKKAKKEEVFIKIPIMIQAVCDYHSLGKFINKLETGDKFYSIKELEIAADLTDFKKSNIAMNITTILKVEPK